MTSIISIPSDQQEVLQVIEINLADTTLCYLEYMQTRRLLPRPSTTILFLVILTSSSAVFNVFQAPPPAGTSLNAPLMLTEFFW